MFGRAFWFEFWCEFEFGRLKVTFRGGSWLLKRFSIGFKAFPMLVSTSCATRVSKFSSIAACLASTTAVTIARILFWSGLGLPSTVLTELTRGIAPNDRDVEGNSTASGLLIFEAFSLALGFATGIAEACRPWDLVTGGWNSLLLQTALHVGQVAFLRSQVNKQVLWKRWLHTVLSDSSPSETVSLQIVQTESFWAAKPSLLWRTDMAKPKQNTTKSFK